MMRFSFKVDKQSRYLPPQHSAFGYNLTNDLFSDRMAGQLEESQLAAARISLGMIVTIVMIVSPVMIVSQGPLASLACLVSLGTIVLLVIRVAIVMVPSLVTTVKIVSLGG